MLDSLAGTVFPQHSEGDTQETQKDALQQNVFFQLQKGIPLVSEPFVEMAARCGTEEATVLEILQQGIQNKLIRSISPIFDTRVMGYDSALVALQIPKEQIEQAAELISQHPGVSHNYEREHPFNVWFTLATPPDSRLGIERTVAVLAQQAGAEHSVILRATKTFKIGVKLHQKGHGLRKERVSGQEKSVVLVNDREKQIIVQTQQPLPLVARPFAVHAEALHISEQQLLATLQDFQERGILRRVAGVLYHHKVGFQANGMSVWRVPAEQAESIGQQVASFQAVSHCYLRTTSPSWSHNLFAMIHGKTRHDVEQVVQAIRQETQLQDHLVLYSIREFKKKRILYFSPDLHLWEQSHTHLVFADG